LNALIPAYAYAAQHDVLTILVALFIFTQVLYTLALLLDAYFHTLRVKRVDMREGVQMPAAEWPYIVMFYPVLREPESTMRTTLLSLNKLAYPRNRYSVIAIPNSDDDETIARLERLALEFNFLIIVKVPPTSDSSWQLVWDAWEKNPKAYWWHRGPRAHVKNLPPKKTRQLIYGFYQAAAALKKETNLVISYIDADSCPPVDHFKAAAIGLKRYDVLQAQNIAGNLNASMAASWHAFDHMAWDSYKYPHFSAGPHQPYWMLGKGLFFKATDLLELGGFHPWITIEDPELGLRFWVNGKKLGIITDPLIEEVPETWGRGVTQRKRWICGFFQTLGDPLDYLALTPWQRVKCWLLFLPSLSLFFNAIGIPTGIWALWAYLAHDSIIPQWSVWLAAFNVTFFCGSLFFLYLNTWRQTAIVLDRTIDRVWYLLRVNPLSLMIWWFLWIIPLTIGLRMYLRGEGLVWERTEKIDANNALVRDYLKRTDDIRLRTDGRQRTSRTIPDVLESKND
jgi:cellulose synthase/poly-beta-1,6-N-acetylglucosamine synthase-like glycosyltransferase